MNDDNSTTNEPPVNTPTKRPARPPRWVLKLNRHRHEERVATTVMSACPWLSDVDRPAVRAWAQFERLSQEAYQHIRKEGLVVKGANGEHPHPLIDKLIGMRKAQTHLAAQLGLTPRARAEARTGGGSDVFEVLVKRVEALQNGEVEVE